MGLLEFNESCKISKIPLSKLLTYLINSESKMFYMKKISLNMHVFKCTNMNTIYIAVAVCRILCKNIWFHPPACKKYIFLLSLAFIKELFENFYHNLYP